MSRMSAESEECRACNGPKTVSPDENIPLCNGHWNTWLNLYLNLDYTGNEPPTCGAHLIVAGATE